MSGSQLLLANAEGSSDHVRLMFNDEAGSPSLFGGKQSNTCCVEVAGWSNRVDPQEFAEFVSTQDHSATLAQMLLSHQSADFCLVGGKVCTLKLVHKVRMMCIGVCL